jgi:hypothetical protein
VTWYELGEQPEELRNQIGDSLKELATIQELVKLSEQRSAVLRQQLLTTLEVLGLEVGDCMEAADLGLYVKVASMTRHRFTEDAGVPAELIEKATLTSHSRSYLRIAPLKD